MSMTNPLAGPAGPGKFSTRTDKLEMGSIAYGEGIETEAIKSGSLLSKTPDAVSGPQETVRPAPLTGLFAETERSDVPITDGIDMGAGRGSNALQMQKETDIDFRAAIQAAKPVLAFVMDQPSTSPETRAVIKQLWNMT